MGQLSRPGLPPTVAVVPCDRPNSTGHIFFVAIERKRDIAEEGARLGASYNVARTMVLRFNVARPLQFKG